MIVTDTGGLGEAVEQGRSGYVVPPGDVPALAAAIESVFETADKAEKMGQYARTLAETTYSWRAAALQTCEIYQRLL